MGVLSETERLKPRSSLGSLLCGLKEVIVVTPERRPRVFREEQRVMGIEERASSAGRESEV